MQSEEEAGPKLRVDYFDTKQQVRQFVERQQEEAKAAKKNKKKKGSEPAE